ncbi:putative OPA3-like protein CG13603 [Cylas formicarius]|uniref:putative OPA3-like protein CG13603 n=1 Tax=Cylas formicarius TaxID=197179 RepID=UPI002958D637|nr:putative OPA3-like protein CG13603 [Cylas formicarius]
MVIGAFPAAKLGALLLKQISKPIANVVKNQAKSSPVFRKYVCMPPAQFYNWCEVKAKMWILNLGKPVNIPVLNEAQAIELGANLLGEAIIFVIAAGILINEYARSAKKESAKEEARKQEIISIQNDIRDLYIQAEEERAQIRELIRKIADQDTILRSLELKLGVKPADTSPPYEPPSYSPANVPVPPEVKVIPEVYGLNTLYKCQQQNSSLILQVVNEVESEFWNHTTTAPQEPYLLLGLYHLSQVFRFKL